MINHVQEAYTLLEGKDDRKNVYVLVGPPGVGKSTFIGNWLKTYKEKYPKNSIFVFSPKLNDPAFDKIKNLHYVKIEPSYSNYTTPCCKIINIQVKITMINIEIII